MRTVIVHYHLFKNAGTSVEHILKKTFGKSWTQMESHESNGTVRPSEMSRFLSANPGVRAVSSHQALLPLPTGTDFAPTSLMLLRHPIDRVRSVYAFESKQKVSNQGTEFASRHTFAEYVRWRLDTAKNGVIHNFHTFFLLRREAKLAPKLDIEAYQEAWQALTELPFFGFVEEFNTSIRLFNQMHAGWVELKAVPGAAKNVTQKSDITLADRLDQIRAELGDSLYEELLDRNDYDMRLYTDAWKAFEDRRQSYDIAYEINPGFQR